MHPKINHLIQDYIKEYERLKNPRSLVFIPNQGCVELELEFKNGVKKEFVVPPIYANIIYFCKNRFN